MTDRVDQIYKALRLVPEFDGNTHVLTRFIKLCDQLVLKYISAEAGNELTNLALLNGILNKCTGSASRLINTNGIPDNWTSIRDTLINNFADQRDETSLYNDLALLKQGSSTPQEFYEKCQDIFSTIMTYVSLHESIASTIESKRQLYKKLTLQSFMRGLSDPLGSRIRCMRPDTIEKALEFVHEEMNTLYLQQRNEHVPERKPQHQHQVSQKFSYGLTPPVNSPSQRPFNFNKPFNMPGPSRTFTPQFQQPVPFWKPQPPQGPQFRGPSRTQQMFSAQPSNYNPRSQVFKTAGPRPSTSNTAQPMSGVSPYVAKPFVPRTQHDWSKSGNPPVSNYFKSKEVNFSDYSDPFYEYNSCYEDCYSNDYNDYYSHYEYPDYTVSNYYNSYEPPQIAEIYPVDEATGNPSKENEDFQKVDKSEKLT